MSERMAYLMRVRPRRPLEDDFQDETEFGVAMAEYNRRLRQWLDAMTETIEQEGRERPRGLDEGMTGLRRGYGISSEEPWEKPIAGRERIE